MNLALRFGITFWETRVEQRRTDDHNLKGDKLEETNLVRDSTVSQRGIATR